MVEFFGGSIAVVMIAMIGISIWVFLAGMAELFSPLPHPADEAQEPATHQVWKIFGVSWLVSIVWVVFAAIMMVVLQ